MKILALLSGPIVSGKELVGISVLENLKNKNHQVTVLCNGWNDGHFPSLLAQKNIPYYTFKLGWYYAKKIQWSLNSLIHLPGAWYKFYKVVTACKPDVIYIDSYRFVILLYPFIKKPIAFHVHDAHAHSAKDKWLIQKAAHKINRFISISNFIKNDLLLCGITASKIETIYNGVNIPDAQEVATLNSHEVFNVGIVGQVAIRKGHKDLIEACSILYPQVPICIKIYGDGVPEAVTEIKHLIEAKGLQKQVAWMGFVNDKETIYGGIDVLVAITHSNEPFGLIAAEAQAYQLPVIVARSGGLVEIIEDNVTGFIIEPHDYVALAEKLMHLYKNPTERKAMGKAGYINTRQKFSDTAMYNRIEEVLETTLK